MSACRHKADNRGTPDRPARNRRVARRIVVIDERIVRVGHRIRIPAIQRRRHPTSSMVDFRASAAATPMAALLGAVPLMLGTGCTPAK